MLFRSPLFSRMYVKSMTVEQLYDSLLVATQVDKSQAARWDDIERRRRQWLQQFVVAFETEENDETTTFDGTLQQVRKIRDGNDDGHLCPAGAALLGEAVAELLKTRHVVGVPVGGPQVGHPQGEWWTGEWTLDPRYDDPPGGCAG